MSEIGERVSGRSAVWLARRYHRDRKGLAGGPTKLADECCHKKSPLRKGTM